MTKEFLPLPTKTSAASSLREDCDGSKFWKSYKHKKDVEYCPPVACLNFSPAVPNSLVASSGTRAEVFDILSDAPSRAFTKSKEPILSSAFRNDGKLLALGNALGQIFVFDVESKLLLRTLLGHKNSVRALSFLPNRINLASSSDDGTVRIWDVAAGLEVSSFQESLDYVRTLSVCQSNSSLLASGCYDGFVRLYDVQKNVLLLSVFHGSPVESVQLSHDGTQLFSTGDNVVKVWNILSGGTLVHSFVCHQKTVTCSMLTQDGRFLLTGSLDHSVKVIDVTSYKVLHSWTFSSPVGSVVVTRDALAVALSNGVLAFRIKKSGILLSSSAIPYKMIPILAKPSFYDKKRLGNINNLIKKFHYRSALSKAFETCSAELIASMVEELSRVNGLLPALSGHTESAILGFLKLASKNIIHPNYTSAFSSLTTHIIDNLGKDGISIDPKLMSILSVMLNVINQEIDLQKSLVALSGALDILQGSITTKDLQ